MPYISKEEADDLMRFNPQNFVVENLQDKNNKKRVIFNSNHNIVI